MKKNLFGADTCFAEKRQASKIRTFLPRSHCRGCEHFSNETFASVNKPLLTG
jgi:hypothetical protein